MQPGPLEVLYSTLGVLFTRSPMETPHKNPHFLYVETTDKIHHINEKLTEEETHV